MGATVNQRDDTDRSAAQSCVRAFRRLCQGGSRMNMINPGPGLVRRLGVAAAAIFLLSAASQQRAEALSLASPGTAPVAKSVAEGLKTEIRGGHIGGHIGGGGF